MIKTLIKFFLLLSIYQVHGQVSVYYHNINLAEEQVIKGAYDDAVHYYMEAFNVSEDVLFSKDVHNALLCSTYADDMVSFTFFAQKFRRFDISNERINLRYKTKLDDRFLEVLLLTPTSFSMNPTLCSFLKKIHTLDMSIRKRCIEDSNCFDCSIEIGKLDSINLKLIIDFVKVHGFPSELMWCDNNGDGQGSIDMVILHNTAPKYKNNHILLKEVVFQLLHEAVIAGQLHPQAYACRVDQLMASGQLGSRVYASSSHLIVEDRLFIFPLADDDELKTINEARKSIYLDDHVSFQRKVAFQKFNPNFRLIYPELLPVLEVHGESKDNILKQVIPYEVSETFYRR